MSRKIKFKKIKRSWRGKVNQKHLYVTYGTECQCNCDCCRNQSFDKETMEMKKEKLQEKIIEEAGNFRHIVFGGGEPLLKIDEIAEIVKAIDQRNFQSKCKEDEKIYCSLATNGEKSIFLSKINHFCQICRLFHQIVLSRYHYDDEKNEMIFKSKSSLIDSQDLSKLCLELKRKIQLSCLCQKDGIETIEDIKQYLNWAKELGITNVMFSNFQDEVTVSKAKKLGCDLSFLADAQEMMEKDLGFEKEPTIVFSAGYKITNYTKFIPAEVKEEPIPIHSIMQLMMSELLGIEDMETNSSIITITNVKMTVSFREFISEEELRPEWKKARRKTYNYSIMPNGTMYEDWGCKVEKK